MEIEIWDRSVLPAETAFNVYAPVTAPAGIERETPGKAASVRVTGAPDGIEKEAACEADVGKKVNKLAMSTSSVPRAEIDNCESKILLGFMDPTLLGCNLESEVSG